MMWKTIVPQEQWKEHFPLEDKKGCINILYSIAYSYCINNNGIENGMLHLCTLTFYFYSFFVTCTYHNNRKLSIITSLNQILYSTYILLINITQYIIV